MCGIIAVFNTANPKAQVETALKLLENRGKDNQGVVHKQNYALGHTLHAIVGHTKQPITKKGTLIANCEIYNYKQLAQKYNLSSENDAQTLLEFLDKDLPLEELDGVYAFLYKNNNTITIARDLVGIKPLWFSHTRESFAICSEKKVLEKLGFDHIQELNPRHQLTYDAETNELLAKKREFFTLKENKETKEQIKQTTKELLHKAIDKRIPDQKIGLLFSGGVDSTYLATYFKNNNVPFTCYTAALEAQNEAQDLIYAKKAAKLLNLELKTYLIKKEDIPEQLKEIVPLIEDSNPVKASVALTFYLAAKRAQEDGCKVIFSGLGSEEIFAGYDRHKKARDINQECLSGLRKMYERDLYRDDVLTMQLNLELRVPFLDKELIDYALSIPAEYKIIDEQTKVIFREIAQEEGVPQEIAQRKKKAAQYGSKLDQAIGKLAKSNDLSKAAYLRGFYPMHNLKLGVLFSSGKDSTYAAYIMEQQNYELSCLITLKSKNPDSYMFHTPTIELAKLQAQAMNLPIIMQDTKGEKEEELEDLKIALTKAKKEYHIDAIVSGAVLSTYQRERIEKICEELGLKVFSPLWHKEPKQEMQELLDQNFTIMLTAIAGDGLDQSWLARPLTQEDINKLNVLQDKIGLHANGEGGEFESLVLDCPLFEKKLNIIKYAINMENTYTGRVEVQEAKLE